MKITESILDNDLYKFSMSYSYMKLFPDAEELYEKVKKIYSYFDPNGFNYKNYNLLISDIKEYTDANYKREALNL